MWLVVELVPGALRFTAREKKGLEWSWSSRCPTNKFVGLHYPLTWSNGFCGGRGTIRCYERKRQRYTKEKYLYCEFCLRKRGWKQHKRKEWSNLNFFQNCLFWTYIKINQHIHLLVLVNIHFTPSEGPKGFVDWFKKIN